jgi:RNase P subunit RPR2
MVVTAKHDIIARPRGKVSRHQINVLADFSLEITPICAGCNAALQWNSPTNIEGRTIVIICPRCKSSTRFEYRLAGRRRDSL